MRVVDHDFARKGQEGRLITDGKGLDGIGVFGLDRLARSIAAIILGRAPGGPTRFLEPRFVRSPDRSGRRIGRSARHRRNGSCR